MSKYLATFYSHFGAITYYKAIEKQGISAKLMPVPRKVSSSCGTCVCYEHSGMLDIDGCELECIYRDDGGALVCVVEK